MMNSDIKLGIVGTNFVSDWFADSVAASEGIECAAVYSRKTETGSAFAEKHGIPSVFTDYGRFLSSGIDAVYIASPNACHFRQAEEALRRGLHAIVEKPATTTEEEFNALTKTADENGVVLLEAMRPVHDPVIKAIREQLGSLGQLRRAVLEFCQYSSRYDRFKKGEIMNAFDPSLGNAAVMDIGVYAIETAVMLFGKPESVRSSSYLLSNGMEGMGTAVLGYGYFDTEIVYSKIHDSVTPSYITGENGSVIIGKISTGENVSVKMRGECAVALMPERSDLDPTYNMKYEISDFVKAVRGEIAADEYREYTRVTLAVIDEIRRQSGIEFK